LLLERFYYRLGQEEKDILNTIVSIKRRNDPSYAYI
jgi:hypothetical protein